MGNSLPSSQETKPRQLVNRTELNEQDKKEVVPFEKYREQQKRQNQQVNYLRWIRNIAMLAEEHLEVDEVQRQQSQQGLDQKIDRDSTQDEGDSKCLEVELLHGSPHNQQHQDMQVENKQDYEKKHQQRDQHKNQAKQEKQQHHLHRPKQTVKTLQQQRQMQQKLGQSDQREQQRDGKTAPLRPVAPTTKRPHTGKKQDGSGKRSSSPVAVTVSPEEKDHKDLKCLSPTFSSHKSQQKTEKNLGKEQSHKRNKQRLMATDSLPSATKQAVEVAQKLQGVRKEQSGQRTKSPNEEIQNHCGEIPKIEQQRETKCGKEQTTGTSHQQQHTKRQNQNEEVSFSPDQSTSKDVDVTEFNQACSEQHKTTHCHQQQKQASLGSDGKDRLKKPCQQRCSKKLGTKTETPQHEHCKPKKLVGSDNLTSSGKPQQLCHSNDRVNNVSKKQKRHLKREEKLVSEQAPPKKELFHPSRRETYAQSEQHQVRPQRRRHRSMEPSHMRPRRDAIQPRRIASDDFSPKFPNRKETDKLDHIAQEMQLCYQKHSERYTLHEHQLRDVYFQQLGNPIQSEHRRTRNKMSDDDSAIKMKSHDTLGPFYTCDNNKEVLRPLSDYFPNQTRSYGLSYGTGLTKSGRKMPGRAVPTLSKITTKKRRNSMSGSRSMSPSQRLPKQQTTKRGPLRPRSVSPRMCKLSEAPNQAILNQLASVKCVNHEDLFSKGASLSIETHTRRQSRRSATVQRKSEKEKLKSQSRLRALSNEWCSHFTKTEAKPRHQSQSPYRKANKKPQAPGQARSDNVKHQGLNAARSNSPDSREDRSCDTSSYSPTQRCQTERGRQPLRNIKTKIINNDHCTKDPVLGSKSKPKRHRVLGRSLTPGASKGGNRRVPKSSGQKKNASRHLSAPARSNSPGPVPPHSPNVFGSWVMGSSTDATIAHATDNLHILADSVHRTGPFCRLGVGCCWKLALQEDFSDPNFPAQMCSRHFGCAWLSDNSKDAVLQVCDLSCSLRAKQAQRQDSTTVFGSSSGPVLGFDQAVLRKIENKMDMLSCGSELPVCGSGPGHFNSAEAKPTCDDAKPDVSPAYKGLLTNTGTVVGVEAQQRPPQSIHLQPRDANSLPSLGLHAGLWIIQEPSTSSGPSLNTDETLATGPSLSYDHPNNTEKGEDNETLAAVNDSIVCSSEKPSLPQPVKLPPRSLLGPATASAESWIKRREASPQSSCATNVASSPAMFTAGNSPPRVSGKTGATRRARNGAGGEGEEDDSTQSDRTTFARQGSIVLNTTPAEQQIQRSPHSHASPVRPQRRHHYANHPQCYQLHHQIRRQYHQRRLASRGRKRSRLPNTPSTASAESDQCSGSTSLLANHRMVVLVVCCVVLFVSGFYLTATFTLRSP